MEPIRSTFFDKSTPASTNKRNPSRFRLLVELLESRVVPSAAFAQFLDPHPAFENGFGATVVPLRTGNVVITSPGDDAGGTDAGAVYLFNGATGALISTLIGSHDGDALGSDVPASVYHPATDAVVSLSNGNFLINSPLWNGGCGAVTYGSGIHGVRGIVSASNSLVGSKEQDQVGAGGVTLLRNGNYVVHSPQWNTEAGAVTFANGGRGIKGAVSRTNSFVGDKEFARVGYGGVTPLADGSYVIRSPFSQTIDGAVMGVGAVTYCAGSTGRTGTLTANNSLIGNAKFLGIGSGGITALPNGNYIVLTPSNTEVGAATLCKPGAVGTVSEINSLVGRVPGDMYGARVFVLNNGNYVICSPSWDNGDATDAGAATFFTSNSQPTGPIDVGNSLVGSNIRDEVGSEGVTALTNGNYVVTSSYWSNGNLAGVGAVTFGNGTTGINGVVSAGNSLVGASPEDFLGLDGGVVALANGNYVVSSPWWRNGAASHAGAVTFGSGLTGITGTVTPANSLVGTQAQDEVGRSSGFFRPDDFHDGYFASGVTALANGNYVVVSSFWDNGAGAATFGNGTTGIVGTIGAGNSLIGDHGGWDPLAGAGARRIDNVGSGGAIALSNGNYVVSSPLWDGDLFAGGGQDIGAVTFCNGTSGTLGTVTPANSLVGSTSWDVVGAGGVFTLSNGSYVVNSPGYGVGLGSVTFTDGDTGISGIINNVNSTIGSQLGQSYHSQRVSLDNVNKTILVPIRQDTISRVRVGSQVDGFAPTLKSLQRRQPLAETTFATSVTFVATFSQKVSGVAAANFGLSGTALVGTIGTPSTTDGGKTWSIPVSGLGSAKGSIALDLIDNANIENEIGSLLATGTFSGDSYLINNSTTTATKDAVLSFSNSDQAIVFNATVTSTTGAVNEGTVTFTLKDTSGNVIGVSVTSAIVSKGRAKASFILPGGTSAGSYSIEANYGDAGAAMLASSSDVKTLTVKALATTTLAQSASVTVDATDQFVSLAAMVVSKSVPVNSGSVTFTVTNASGDIIGSQLISSTVVNGFATVNFIVPMGTPAGSYKIAARYNPGNDFQGSADGGKMLGVFQATVTAVSDVLATFNSSKQTVALQAAVTTRSGSANTGTVKFTITDGTGKILGTVSGSVRTGQAKANFTLPGGLFVGTYQISAVYSGRENLAASSDSTGTLTIMAASTTLLATNVVATSQPTDQFLALSATVLPGSGALGTVNEGTVTFMLVDNLGVSIGVPVTSAPLFKGRAKAIFTLPGGTATGTYKIVADFSGTVNFKDSSDDSRSLSIA